MNKLNSLSSVKSYNNNGSINNNNNINNNNLNVNKRPLIDTSQPHMPVATSASASLSPHSPSTSSSSNSSARHMSNLNTSCSSSSSINMNNNNNDLMINAIPNMPIFNDMNLRLNLITHLLRYNDLELNCVQFVNLIDLYFEDDINNNGNNTNSINGTNGYNELSSFVNRKSNDSMSFLNDLKQSNITTQNSNELKLISDSSTVTTTCFPCIVCSNRFSFEQTFHLHLERRSILIRFYCIKCQAFKSFYNRCKLLYHVYSHKMYLFEAIYRSIRIESITIERLNLSKERNIDFSSCINFFPSPDIDDLISKNNDFNESLSLLQPIRVPQSENESIKTFLRRLVHNKFLLFRCSVCDALFFDLKELKIHYYKTQQHELEHLVANNSNCTNNNNGANRRYIYKNLKQKYANSFNKSYFGFLSHSDVDTAKINKFIGILNDMSLKKLQFSTRCSTLANMNLISSNYQFYLPATQNNNVKKLNRPLICPECGISFDPKTQLEKFRLHLLYECLFTSKYDCGQIKCFAIDCNYLAESVNDFVIHWSKFHIKNEHLCDLCDKKGLKVVFESDSSVNTQINDSIKSQSTKNNLISNQDDLDENELNSSNFESNNTNNDSILSSATITEINKHFFEKHRNLKIALKLNYRCSCKTATNLLDSSGLNEMETNAEVNGSSKNSDCEHTTWKGCHKHIINLIARTLASINCLICNKLLPNHEYQSHLKNEHNLERICVCPLCGVLKDENSLQNHIFKMHSQLNLNDQPTSSFFNLITTLSKQLNTTQLMFLNTGNINSLLQSSPYILPENFFVYQCLNCRLFFASNCKFSHNCWTYTELNKPTTPLGSKDQKQHTNNNYFSPIYMKFNLMKSLFSMSKSILTKKNTENESNNTSECKKKMKISDKDLSNLETNEKS